VPQFKKKHGGIAFLGSPPAILGGPQKNQRRFCLGILDGLNWVRLAKKSEPMGQRVEEQEEMQFSDAIDGPSISTDSAVPLAIPNGFA
jgi:hypothetical protein